LAGECAPYQHDGRLSGFLRSALEYRFLFPSRDRQVVDRFERLYVFIRGLSGFHIVLPLLLLWMLHRLGYDQRAFLWQTIVALVILPVSYLASNTHENVNWVYGFGQNPQRILPAPLFVMLLMLLFPLVVYLPTHLLFARIFRGAGS
jgi:hypothetical protein